MNVAIAPVGFEPLVDLKNSSPKQVPSPKSPLLQPTVQTNGSSLVFVKEFTSPVLKFEVTHTSVSP